MAKNIQNSSISHSEVTQSCPTLCDPMDCSLTGSCIYGIFQARVLEWVAISSSRGSSWPRHGTQVFHIAGRHFTIWATNSVQFSPSAVSNSLQPHGLQHARPPCPSPTPRVYSNSCPLSWWCNLTISSSAVPFSFCLQSFPASRSFPMSQLFASGGQSIGVSASASVLPEKYSGLISFMIDVWTSLEAKGLSGVFSNITVQKHQYFGAYLSL